MTKGCASASSVPSQILIKASAAGVVEKDKVAELELTALIVSPVITASVGDVPSVLELPPHPSNNAHSHIGMVIVRFRGIGF